MVGARPGDMRCSRGAQLYLPHKGDHGCSIVAALHNHYHIACHAIALVLQPCSISKLQKTVRSAQRLASKREVDSSTDGHRVNTQLLCI